MNVGIIYGWSEGKWQGKLLRRELNTQGFSVTSDIASADILIAHSGGCYLLPENGKANLVLLVGIPWHPTEHPLRGLMRKVQYEVKDLWWYKKTFFNIWYLLTRPLRWVRMYHAWKSKRLPSTSESIVLAVRNKNDHFMHPVDSAALATSRGWKMENLTGHHDDLWINPKPYVELIKRHLKDQ